MSPTGHTRVYAVLGRPVGHSLSPAIYNPLFREHGIDAVYVALDVPPEAAVHLADALRTLGLAGVNLTVPHKATILDDLDTATDAVRASGAANVVRCDSGRLHGHNTDGTGFWDAWAHRFGGDVGRVVLLGAGGAARAIAHEALVRGARRVTFLNRTPGRAERAVERLRRFHPQAALHVDTLDADGLSRHAAADIVVQALPAGARALVEALPIEVLRPGASWADLNYWDADPPCFARCRRHGLTTWTGHDMLAFQGARAFEVFTGIQVDPVRVAAELG